MKIYLSLVSSLLTDISDHLFQLLEAEVSQVGRVMLPFRSIYLRLWGPNLSHVKGQALNTELTYISLLRGSQHQLFSRKQREHKTLIENKEQRAYRD